MISSMAKKTPGELKKLQAVAVKFRADRDWEQFHTPKDMALSGLVSVYSKGEIEDIVEKITSVVSEGKIDTRGNNRGKLKGALVAEFPELEKKIKPYSSSERNTVIRINEQTGLPYSMALSGPTIKQMTGKGPAGCILAPKSNHVKHRIEG